MPRPSSLLRLEDHGAGGVPEQHQQVAEAGVPLELLVRQRAGVAAVEHLEGALRERHQGGVDVGAHQQDGARDAAPDQGVHHLEAVGVAGALLADVQGRQRPHPELLLDQRARAREVVVRRHGGADQVVDLARGHAGVVEGRPRRFRPEIGRADARLDVVAGHDAAALPDPLVVGLDDAGEHVVVDLERRDGDAGAREDGSSLGHTDPPIRTNGYRRGGGGGIGSRFGSRMESRGPWASIRVRGWPAPYSTVRSPCLTKR